MKEMNKKQEKLSKYKKIVLIIKIVLMIVILLLTILNIKKIISFNQMLYPYISLLILLVLILIIDMFLSSKLGSYYHEIKKSYLSKTLSKYFDKYIYDINIGLTESDIYNTGMMDIGNIFESNDYIKSNYKGIEFETSDVIIEEEIEKYNDNDEIYYEYNTIFQGRWFIFDFNKKFKYDMEVFSKEFDGNIIPKHFKKVLVEDIKFNKRFKIYSESEHNAFYILTPSLIEKINSLYDKISDNILLCFKDGKLHLAINNFYDAFEFNINKKLNEKEIIDNMSTDVELILELIDSLCLNKDVINNE